MRIKTLLILLLIALPTIANAESTLNIFACEPEYAALAKELTPENTHIFSATTAQQDPHFIQARPSLIAKMRQANLVICAGADLEAGWLNLLLNKSNNRQVQSSEQGLFLAADHVENLDIPLSVDRSQGDVHELGNPHVHLDPARVQQLAKALTARLQKLLPEQAALFQQKYQNFEQRWQLAIKQWQHQTATLKGKKIISYHSSFRYLFAFLGMEKIADLEPKAGLPPTTAHLSALLNIIKQEQVQVVVYSAYQQAKPAQWLADKTGIKALQLPFTIGGNEQANNLFSLMDSHISLLLNAYQEGE